MNDFFQKIPLFAGLADDAIERLVAMSTQIELKPGEYLMREDELGDSMYVVVDGRARGRRSVGGNVGAGQCATRGVGDCADERARAQD
jgi:CRP-like cAMP-binding protein